MKITRIDKFDAPVSNGGATAPNLLGVSGSRDGGSATPVAVNSSISTGTADEMIALTRAASADGYCTHSAKIGGSDLAMDIARMDAISVALPAGEKATFDVNRA